MRFILNFCGGELILGFATRTWHNSSRQVSVLEPGTFQQSDLNHNFRPGTLTLSEVRSTWVTG